MVVLQGLEIVIVIHRIASSGSCTAPSNNAGAALFKGLYSKHLQRKSSKYSTFSVANTPYKLIGYVWCV